MHRLRHIDKFDLAMIEFQSGAYLGEDDIVRFEDNYGRAPYMVPDDQTKIVVAVTLAWTN